MICRRQTAGTAGGQSSPKTRRWDGEDQRDPGCLAVTQRQEEKTTEQSKQEAWGSPNIS